MRQGYDVYLPRYLKRRRHARRIETVAAPLFPRYLFVAVDTTVQQWRWIHSTFGVSRLVCNGDEPAAVPIGVVEACRSAQDDTASSDSAAAAVRAGDKVRVLDGVFAACLGLYEKMADSERVAVLLDLLGRKVRVVLDADLSPRRNCDFAGSFAKNGPVLDGADVTRSAVALLDRRMLLVQSWPFNADIARYRDLPPDHGGPASYVPMIASELEARNHEIVAIVTLSDLVDGNGYDFPVIRFAAPRGGRSRSCRQSGRSCGTRVEPM